MIGRVAVGLTIAVLSAVAARAGDFKFDGYADVRLIVPSSDDDTWLEGGLSKTRFGRADGDVDVRLGEIVGEGTWQIAPEVLALASVRYDEDQRTPIDLLEAYVRYRPVSTTRWRWSVKAGAFFPPISLENDEIGWTSTWTLTPSAINTWVGEEFRTIGAEAKVELRGTTDTFEANAAVFGANDPAGVLIADRGWALGDRPTGLFDQPRLPDAFVISMGKTPPRDTPMFKEIDDKLGWYGRVAWSREGLGRIEVLRYDNMADPAAKRGVFAWRTEFWSGGVSTEIGDVTLLAQGMAGETEIAPSVFYDSITQFWSAYVLAGWACDDWRFAARAELFATDNRVHYWDGDEFETEEGGNGEHGHAFTLAAAWLPESWLRLSAEALFIDSWRPQRRITGLDPSSADAQLQLGARVYF